jgi:hypothetical protein
MIAQTKTNDNAIRQLTDAELDAVAGGFVELLVYAVGSTAAGAYGYYQYLKWADKI